jgi:lia operon protein LiaF
MGSKSFGLLILALGVVWLLSTFGILPQMSWGDLVTTWWPLLLVWWGFDALVRWRSWIWGGGLILVGAALQFDQLDLIDVSLWSLILPAGLILLGLSLLFGRRYRYGGSTSIRYDNHREKWGASEEWAKVGRKYSSAVGDLHIGGPDWKLESGHFEKKVGSIKLDLQKTFIPEGETELEISCRMGDVDVFLPEGLAVSIEAAVKLGDVKVFTQRNSGSGRIVFQSEEYEEAERKVKLRVWVKIGDIDVQRVG